MQTNVQRQRKFAHEGTEVWKRESRSFWAFSSSFWNIKDFLKVKITKNEGEGARLVKEENFPAFLCTVKFNLSMPHLLKLLVGSTESGLKQSSMDNPSYFQGTASLNVCAVY